MKVCVVFSDAFALHSFNKLDKNSLTDYHLYRLIPGVAYSSNLHYQIFQGKTPDDVGFFCDNEFIGHSNNAPSKFKRTLDRIDSANTIYRWLGYKLGKPITNIPYSEANSFKNTGKYLFKESGDCYVFGRKVLKITEDKYDSNIAFDKAEQALTKNAGDMIIVLNELDHKGHQVSCLGKDYLNAAQNIINRSAILFDKFRTKYPDSYCLLISDHGMSYVHSSINIYDRLYDQFGLPGKDYYFINDSVYLRMWFINKDLKCRIQTWLNSIGALRLLTPDERDYFGVTEYKFGEIIYRLTEGYVFCPNSFNALLKGVPAGMHGYMEPTDTASGIVVSSEKLTEDQSIEARNIYSLIKSYLDNSEI